MNNLFYVSECGDGPTTSGPIILPDIKVEKKNVDWGNVKDSDQGG